MRLGLWRFDVILVVYSVLDFVVVTVVVFVFVFVVRAGVWLRYTFALLALPNAVRRDPGLVLVSVVKRCSCCLLCLCPTFSL